MYFELLRRGYDVAIGKVDNAEVDFIATKADDKLYVQVTESMAGETVRNRAALTGGCSLGFIFHVTVHAGR